ncbi:MAG TPA: hypothetical protein VMF52_06705 [Steroidobacteraceae bacterium]|nr:hypothetical protein [Steroidobacteraceae bacterium]
MNAKKLAATIVAAVVMIGCDASGIEDAVVAPPVPAIPDAPKVTLSISPEIVPTGGAATLTWTASDATACVASGAWSGSQTTSNNAGVSTGPKEDAGTYNYGITCVGPGGGGSSVAQLTVGNPPAPVVNLTMNPLEMQPGDTARLTWSTSNATSCVGSEGSVSQNWAGPQLTNNLQGFRIGPVQAAGEYAFTLSCSGAGGQTSASRILRVDTSAPAAPPNVTFNATPGQIAPGETTTLTWSSTNAATCSGSGGAPGDGWAGSKALSSTGTVIGPLSTTGSFVYTLACTGGGGTTSRNATVVVNSTPQPATVDITISPATIVAGDAAQISWTSTNASNCTASGSWSGAQASSGTNVSTGTIATPGAYAYSLTCDGPGGSSTDTANLTVNAPAADIPTFSALPTTITVGLPITLSWSTTDATSCTASGGTGTDNWTGTVATSSLATVTGALTPAGNYRYTLVCTGPGGPSPPAHVDVTVLPLPPPGNVIGLTVTPNNISVGQTASVTWLTAGATACTASGGATGDGWTGAMPVLSLGTTVGPINVAGTYQYTLTCSGPGGVGAPASTTLVVGPGTPPPTVGSFTATPNIINVGQSISLAWTTTNATGCTASGGAPLSGWLGPVAASSAGTPIGPILTPGTWTYTLTCSGAGGTSGPMSTDVVVNVVTPAPTIDTFVLNPTTVTQGQSSSLSWTTSNATACVASGGTGTDGWGGPVATSSTGTSVGPVSSVGTVTYTLTCTGPGAGAPSSSRLLVVGPTPPGAPTVTLTANNQVQHTMQPNAALTMRWTSTNATSCTVSGGTGSDGWGGTVATSSSGQSLTSTSTPGVYTYTINCTGPGGSAAANAVVTVIASTGLDCGIGEPSTALRAPTSTVATSTSGACILGCGIANASRVIDSDNTNFATMNVLVGLGTTVSLWVEDTSTTYPAGRKVGFLVSDPGTLLTVGALQNVRVRTYLDGVQQETASVNDVLDISALGLLQDPEAAFVGFRATKPFDRARIDLFSVASVLDTKRVYGSCVTLQ